MLETFGVALRFGTFALSLSISSSITLILSKARPADTTAADIAEAVPSPAGAVRLAGDIADGLVGHTIWSDQWIVDRVMPNLAKGLAKAGRQRQSFDLNLGRFVALGPDKRQCIEDTRQSIAFYASFAQYERYFTEIGFGAEARALCQAAQAKDERALRRACSDAMVEQIALVGSIDEARARVNRLAAVTDSFSLAAPFHGLSPEQIGEYNRRIAEAFYQ